MLSVALFIIFPLMTWFFKLRAWVRRVTLHNEPTKVERKQVKHKNVKRKRYVDELLEHEP